MTWFAFNENCENCPHYAELKRLTVDFEERRCPLDPRRKRHHMRLAPHVVRLHMPVGWKCATLEALREMEKVQT